MQESGKGRRQKNEQDRTKMTVRNRTEKEQKLRCLVCKLKNRAKNLNGNDIQNRKKENKQQTTTKEVIGHNKNSDQIEWPIIR